MILKYVIIGDNGCTQKAKLPKSETTLAGGDNVGELNESFQLEIIPFISN